MTKKKTTKKNGKTKAVPSQEESTVSSDEVEVIELLPTVSDADAANAILNSQDSRTNTIKYRQWVMNFCDPKRTLTYGNATKSALAVYDTKDYSSAGVIGHENLKKLKKSTTIVLESLGYDFAKLMKIGAEKMEKEGYDTWEKFMIRIGVFEPMSVPGNQGGNQFNFENLNVAIMQDRKARGLSN